MLGSKPVSLVLRQFGHVEHKDDIFGSNVLQVLDKENFTERHGGTVLKRR